MYYRSEYLIMTFYIIGDKRPVKPFAIHAGKVHVKDHFFFFFTQPRSVGSGISSADLLVDEKVFLLIIGLGNSNDE